MSPIYETQLQKKADHNCRLHSPEGFEEDCVNALN